MTISHSGLLFGPPCRSNIYAYSRYIKNILVHRRTQDFTMDRVHVVGAGRGDLGDGSAQLDPGTKAKCKN